MTPFKLEAFKSKSRWYWRVRSNRNGKIIMDGAEGYATKRNLLRAIDNLPFRWELVDKRFPE